MILEGGERANLDGDGCLERTESGKKEILRVFSVTSRGKEALSFTPNALARLVRSC